MPGNQAVGKLGAVVSLDALNDKGELLRAALDKFSGGVSAVLLKCLQITETAVFVKEGILIIPTFLGSGTNQAALRDKFDVDLHPLTWILHLFIGLGDIFRVWQLLCHLATLAQETIQSRDGACVAPQPQLYPEYHQTSIGIAAAHIPDKFNFVGAMLVWMAVRTMGTILQGLQRSVIALAPAVDILPIGAVADCRFCHSVLLCIAN